MPLRVGRVHERAQELFDVDEAGLADAGVIGRLAHVAVLEAAGVWSWPASLPAPWTPTSKPFVPADCLLDMRARQCGPRGGEAVEGNGPAGEGLDEDGVITTHGVANYHWRNWLNKLPMTEYSVSGIFRQWAPPRALRFPYT